MKKKITELVFVPLVGAVSEISHCLTENRRNLLIRGLSVDIRQNPDRIVATFEEEFPQTNGACLLNAYIDDRLLDRMRIKSVTITYLDAVMPRVTKGDMEGGQFFLNGEHSVLYRVGTTAKFITPTVTCLPSRKTVFISLEINDGGYDEKNNYRKALLDAQFKVERVILATKAAKQLIQAFRSTPQNQGFIDRSIKELYAAIGRC